MKDDDFFVGWSGKLPRRDARLIWTVALAGLVLMAMLAMGLARATDDPGDGQFDWTAGEQKLTGVLTLAPYPTLWLPPAAGAGRGHTVMLAGTGKTGPDLNPALDGKLVRLAGIMLHRGTLDMLMVTTSPADLNAAVVPRVPVAPLGRWRITGAICDGKCEAGAMRPGSGLAHRACASLCLSGGVPPVLATTGPVEGTSFLLLGGPRDRALPAGLHGLVALLVTLQGEVSRRGDMLVFTTDLRPVARP